MHRRTAGSLRFIAVRGIDVLLVMRQSRNVASSKPAGGAHDSFRQLSVGSFADDPESELHPVGLARGQVPFGSTRQCDVRADRSEEHTSELQYHSFISY